jgi:hypothetical protein
MVILIPPAPRDTCDGASSRLRPTLSKVRFASWVEIKLSEVLPHAFSPFGL